MHTVTLVLVQPLILGVTGLLVIAIAWMLNRVIPEGRVKRFLFKQRGISARTVSREELASMPQPTPEAARLAYRASRPRSPSAE